MELLLQLFPDAIKAPQSIEFLTHLMRHVQRPVLVIWDGLPGHRSADVRDFVAAQRGRLALEFLPGWEKGIRIGSVKADWVHYMIPEFQMLNPKTGGTIDTEFIGLDSQGNIYAGEVQGQKLIKYVRSPWFDQPSDAGILNFRPVGSQ